jgi:hypothetical protein
MPFINDLGGAPANEECASLGHTPDFDHVNRFEVFAYRIAFIAKYGSPPPGCRLAFITNRHDFGTYMTLGLRVDITHDGAVQAYAGLIEDGLGSWLEAGFAPPVTYKGSTATIHREDYGELVIGALLTTRPNLDGRFALIDFETIHTNLAAAFPEQAEIARRRLITPDTSPKG